MKRRLINWRLLSYLLLYCLVILYTLTFPTAVSWFVFYAFSFLLILAYFSTKLYLVVDNVNWHKSEYDGIEISCDVYTLGKIPFFLPSIDLILSKGSHVQTVHTSAFFSRNLKAVFRGFSLPRGHHESMDLTVRGRGLFGIFRYQTARKLTVSLDIYPTILTKSSIASFIQEITPTLRKKNFSTIHEFHVRDIRAYQDRDSLSDIDWKSSLKRDKWMIKEYDHEGTDPIGIYFFGVPSSHFEDLLAVAYSIYQDLTLHQNATIYLLGEFKGTIKVEQSKESFLHIKPTEENLNQLWHDYAPKAGMKIVIAPKAYSFPIHPSQRESIIQLTEDHFL